MGLASTPLSMYMVFFCGADKGSWAIYNSYAFSVAYNWLYLAPLVQASYQPFAARLDRATMNWLVWLSVFTQLAFQIPHNLCVALLHRYQGTVYEWPFFAYGQSDSRWNEYNDGTALHPTVWLINTNDAGLGLMVGACLLHTVRTRRSPSVMLILMALFRDATLWRETVEYMWDHHRLEYPYTTQEPTLRPHAIACLWSVNICWL